MSKSTEVLRGRIEAWRTRRKLLHRLRSERGRIDEAISVLEEDAANEEFEIARALKPGPVEVDGRRFSFEVRDGCPSIRVDAALHCKMEDSLCGA